MSFGLGALKVEARAVELTVTVREMFSGKLYIYELI